MTISAQTWFRYQYSNYIGSACLELDHQGEIISYEEYHPYGTSALRAMNNQIEAPPKRYRYTAMEQDGESGLNYHGARYYAPFLARWTACDPASQIDEVNLYAYGGDNPVGLKDTYGKQSASPDLSKEVRDSALSFVGAVYGAGKSLLGGFTAAFKVGYYSMGSNMYFFTVDTTYREQYIQFRQGFRALEALTHADPVDIAKGYITACGNAVTEPRSAQ